MITRLEFYLGIAALALFLLVGGLYLHYEKAGASAVGELKGVVDAQDQRIKQAEQTLKDSKAAVPVIQKAEVSRESDLARALAQFATAKQQPVDYDELARKIKERLGVEAKLSGPPANLPNAPSSVTIPAKQLRDYMTDCDAANVNVESCKLGLTNRDKIIAELNTQLTADGVKISAITAERDQAQKTVTKLRGGNAFERTVKDVLKLGLAGGIGYGLGKATTH